MRSGFTILEHPSDLGIEARGATLGEAFRSAARGLMSVIVDGDSVGSRESLPLVVRAADTDQLLVRWLSDILYLYDGKRFVAKEFTIDEFTTGFLAARVTGEPLDPAKH